MCCEPVDLLLLHNALLHLIVGVFHTCLSWFVAGMDSKEQVAGHMTYDQWMSQIPDINCNSSNVPAPHTQLGTQTFEDTT